MRNSFSLALVFVAMAVIFLSVTLRDFLNAESKLTIARRTWLRLAIIFAAVSIGLFFFQTFLTGR